MNKFKVLPAVVSKPETSHNLVISTVAPINKHLVNLPSSLGVSIEFLRALHRHIKHDGVAALSNCDDVNDNYLNDDINGSHNHDSRDERDHERNLNSSTSKVTKNKSKIESKKFSKKSKALNKSNLFNKSLFTSNHKVSVAPLSSVSADKLSPRSVQSISNHTDVKRPQSAPESNNSDFGDCHSEQSDSESGAHSTAAPREHPFMTHEVVEQFIKPLIPSGDSSLVQYLTTHHNFTAPHPELKIVCSSRYISTANVYLIHQYTYTFDALLEAIEGFILAEEQKVDFALSREGGEKENNSQNTDHRGDHMKTNKNRNSHDENEEVRSISFSRDGTNISSTDSPIANKRSNSITYTQKRQFYFWLDFCCLSSFSAEEVQDAQNAQEKSDLCRNQLDESSLSELDPKNTPKTESETPADGSNNIRRAFSNDTASKVQTLLTPEIHMQLMSKINHTVLILLPPTNSVTTTPSPFAVPTPLTRSWVLYEILLTQLASVPFSIQFGSIQSHNKHLHFLATHNLDVINGILNCHRIELEASFACHSTDKQFIANNVLLLLDDGYVEANTLVAQCVQSFVVSTAVEMTRRNIRAVYRSLMEISGTQQKAQHPNNTHKDSANHNHDGDHDQKQSVGRIASSANSTKIRQPAKKKKGNKSPKVSPLPGGEDSPRLKYNNRQSKAQKAGFSFTDMILLAFGCYAPVAEESQSNAQILSVAQTDTLLKIGALKQPISTVTEDTIRTSSSTALHSIDELNTSTLLPLSHNYLDSATYTKTNNNPTHHALSEQLVYIDYFEYSLNLTTLLMHNGEFGPAEDIYCELLEYNRNREIKGSEVAVTTGDEIATTPRSLKSHNKHPPPLTQQKPLFRLPPSHPLVLSIQGNLALLYKMQHKYAQAIDTNNDILNTKRDVLGSVHPSVLLTVYNLACCHEDFSVWLHEEARLAEVLGMNKVNEEEDEEVCRANATTNINTSSNVNTALLHSPEVLEHIHSAIDLFLQVVTDFEANYSKETEQEVVGGVEGDESRSNIGSNYPTDSGNSALNDTLNSFLALQHKNTKITSHGSNIESDNFLSSHIPIDSGSSLLLTNQSSNGMRGSRLLANRGSRQNITRISLNNHLNGNRPSSGTNMSALLTDANNNTSSSSLGVKRDSKSDDVNSSVNALYLDAINRLAVIYLIPHTPYASEHTAKLLLQKLLYLKIKQHGELHHDTLHTYETVGALYISAGNNHAHDNELSEEEKEEDEEVDEVVASQSSAVNKAVFGSAFNTLQATANSAINNKRGVKRFGNSFLFNTGGGTGPSPPPQLISAAAIKTDPRDSLPHKAASPNDHHEEIAHYSVAAECFSKALRIRELLYGAQHYSTVQTMLRLARIRLKIASLQDQNDSFPPGANRDQAFLDSLTLFYKVCAYYEGTLLNKTDASGQSYYRYQFNTGTEESVVITRSGSGLTSQDSFQGSAADEDGGVDTRHFAHDSDVMHPSLMDVYESITDIYLVTTQYARAEPLLLVLLSNKEKLFGPHAVTTLTTLYHLADMYVKQQKYVLAESYHLRCLNGRLITLSGTHYDTLLSTYSLACCLVQLNKFVPSVDLLEKALIGFDDYYNNLEETHTTDHAYETAHVISCGVDKSQPNHNITHRLQKAVYSFLVCELLAFVYRKVRNISKSRVLYERLKQHYKTTMGANHPVTVNYTKILMSQEFYKVSTVRSEWK